MKRKKLFIFLAIIAIAALSLIVNHFVRHTGEFIDGKFFWRGSYYHKIDLDSYEFKGFDKIEKTKNLDFNISAIEGDNEYIFLLLWDLTSNYLYVKEDYEIPTSGKVTSVYVAPIHKFEDKKFCEAIDDLLYGGFINDKRKKFIIKTDVMYQLAKEITLSFNDCPVGSEFVGYIGIINNKWVYILSKDIETDQNGNAIVMSYTCYIIDDYDKLPIIKEYVKTENHNVIIEK
ncbi:MAG: hypothetical protein AAGU14_09600 [Eubacteriaceae bacterium]